MKSYRELLLRIQKGNKRGDRTGTGTTSLFGEVWEHDLREGFPLLTTKKIHWKSVINELVFFLRGETDNTWLNDRGVKIWDEWADEAGHLGPIYGAQWSKLNPETKETQLEYVQHALREKPECRRMVCSAWNWGEIHEMALPPCHVLWQVYTEGNLLHMQVYQRSADVFLGVPFNIASYGALLTALASCHGYVPARLRFNFGDVHIYDNHQNQVYQQLNRRERPLPQLRCTPLPTVRLLDVDNFILTGYNPHPSIKAEVAV